MRLWLDIPVAGLTIRIPWIVIQIGVALVAVAVSRLARGSARRETYEPAYLTAWGGLALGAFFAVETLVLAMPNVISRWAGVSYAGLVPWLLLVTALSLMPFVRHLMGETMAMFDDRLGGVVWLLLMVMLLVVGNRLPGLGAAGALIIAQFMAALLVWWMPSPPDPAEVEQVGPSMSLAMAVFIVLVYAYSVTLEYAAVGEWLKGQGLIVLLIAAAVVALPRLFWREEDPWLLHPGLPRGVALAFIAPIVVLGLIVSGLGVDPVPPPLGTTLRIATYNINRGYDAVGAFQLELVARTIEASHADVVLLQEVDAGSPASYGIDEVQYLARRLDMSQAFLPTTEQVRGLAVLSRWPLSSRAGALFPGTGEQDGALSVSIRDADIRPFGNAGQRRVCARHRRGARAAACRAARSYWRYLAGGRRGQLQRVAAGYRLPAASKRGLCRP